MVRKNEGQWIQKSNRLFQQYIVDMYSKIEEHRLTFIKLNQNKIRTEKFNGLLDSIENSESNLSSIGKRIILPSSFIGSPRHMFQLYQDSMNIVRALGKPDIFITFTCNPGWIEIQRELNGMDASERPDICVRVFMIKLKLLLHDLLKKNILGKVIGHIYVIEFQKRGLPHAHILLILDNQSKPRSPDDYDKLVCAEIPDQSKDNELFETVTKCMLHNPCHINKSSPCIGENKKCSKGYPKQFIEDTQSSADGYPLYKRTNNGMIFCSRGVNIDNRSVVPYNPKLCKKYNAHINVEICSSITAVKYLYKYVYKGHDKALIQLVNNNLEKEV